MNSNPHSPFIQRNRVLPILLATLIWAAISSDCSGDGQQRLIVDPAGGEGIFTTIQAAIDAACSGDVIEVTPGTYKESITITNKSICFTKGDLNGGDVIVDACQMGPAVTASADQGMAPPKVSFAEFIFQNGSAGGVALFNVDATFLNSTIRNNASLFSGGGVSQVGGFATFAGTRFENNTSFFDGGASASQDASQIHVGSTFENSMALGNGGALFRQEPTDGSSSIAGSVLDLILIDCVFDGNLGFGEVSNGGAITMENVNAFISGTRFRNNNVPANGGAVEAFGLTNLLILNSIFDGNDAGGAGGAIANIEANINVVNCTLTNNSAAAADIVAATSAATTNIGNSILFGNGGAAGLQEGVGGLSIVFSIVEGGFPGEGNLDVDPQFVDAIGPDGLVSSGDEDLSLQLNSPAIDAGNNDLLPVDLVDLDNDGDFGESTPLDFAMNQRLVDLPGVLDTGLGMGAIVDMGAFELQVKVSVLLGDVNLDGVVNLLDIEPFVELLSGGAFQAEADINQDGLLNLLDIEPFVQVLNNG